MVATSPSYPVITWQFFLDACRRWKTLDKNLEERDLEKIFKLTNQNQDGYDEKLENEQPYGFCRYELIEAIVRMAKVKFNDKGPSQTIS